MLSLISGQGPLISQIPFEMFLGLMFLILGGLFFFIDNLSMKSGEGSTGCLMGIGITGFVSLGIFFILLMFLPLVASAIIAAIIALIIGWNMREV